MIVDIYFLILFSKTVILQSNHLQFELIAFALLCWTLVDNFSLLFLLTSINDKHFHKIWFTKLNSFSVCIECTILMNLVSESEFVTMTSKYHLVCIFVLFSTLSTYVHPLKEFFCVYSAFLTLLEVIGLTINVFFMIRTNLRIFQILSHYYFYVSINISYESFNLYLFKRVTFDVM